MSRRIERVLLLAVGMLGALGAAAFEIDLRTAGVVIADENNPSQKLAAEELEYHLRLLCPERKPNNKMVFYVGKPPSPKLAAVGERFEYRSYAMAQGGRIHLWGDDAARHNGTLFATYLFLEDVLGVRWVRPGDDGIVYRPMNTVSVDDKWRKSYRPPLELSRMRCFGDSTLAGEQYFLPNELRVSQSLSKKMGEEMEVWVRRMRHQNRTSFSYGHSFLGWNEKYLNTHPEYLAMNEHGVRGIPGARTAEQHSRVQICLSSPGAKEQIIQNWIAGGGRKYLNVCANDSTYHCHCKLCCATDADLPGENFNAHKTDRHVRFWNDMIELAREHRKDVVLVVYIYSNWRFPPRREKIKYPDNLIAGIVPSLEQDSCKLISDWNKAGLKTYFVRPNYLCYTGAISRGYERHLCYDFKRNFEMGMVGVDHDHYSRQGVIDFEYYTLSRMIADPTLEFTTIENEFLSQFGVAEKELREYYSRIRERGEADLKKRIAGQRTSKQPKDVKTIDDSLLSGTPYEVHNEHELRTDLALLDKALARRGLTDVERRRIENIRLRLTHGILTARFVKFSQAGEDRAKFIELGRKVLDFRIKHMEDMPDDWGHIMRGFPVECRLWIKSKWYHAEHSEVSTYEKPTAKDLKALDDFE